MFISAPYLPEAAVTLAVSGFEVPGIKIIPPPEIPVLPPQLRRHADLGLCPIGAGQVVCPPDTYSYYFRLLTPYGFSVIKGGQALGVSYPADTAYNVVVVGNFALMNPDICDPILLKLLAERYEIIPVKQGYAKCSVAPIGKTALITADAGICRAAERAGLDTLLIENSGVLLPPYENGFFGGACGMTGPKTLTVNGSIDHMESGGKIRDFLEAHGITAMEIHTGAPFDTGSLIPLKIKGNTNP